MKMGENCKPATGAVKLAEDGAQRVPACPVLGTAAYVGASRTAAGSVVSLPSRNTEWNHDFDRRIDESGTTKK